jgi:hypothetical protein
MKTVVLASIAILLNVVAFAGENEYVMNFDLKTLTADGDVFYDIQLQGIHVKQGRPFHGDDLAEYDYFLTLSQVKDGKAKLTIEFYEYESRKKKSDVVSEIFSIIDVTLCEPVRFESMNNTFGIDMAISVCGS